MSDTTRPVRGTGIGAPVSETRKEQSAARRWISRHQLVAFFGTAYVLMFAATFAYIAGVPVPYQLVWFVSIFSPTIAATSIVFIIGGAPAVWNLLAGFTRWKVGLRWYLAAVFLVAAPLAAALIYAVTGNPVKGLAPGVTAWALAGQFVFTMFSGPLSEEAGWRGFALPRLQQRHGALVASLILGTLWAGWHIPLFFESGAARPGIPFPIYFVIVLVLSILFTWLYNNTGGSLVITALAHLSFNLNGAFITGSLGLIPMNLFFMTAGPALGLFVLIVVLYFGPAKLSRSRSFKQA